MPVQKGLKGAADVAQALLVGNVNSSASCRPCLATLPHDQYCVDRQHPDAPCICCGGLTPVEEQTNMVMWAMFAAPLEIAADLRHIPTPSAAILRNPVSCAGGHQCPVQSCSLPTNV